MKDGKLNLFFGDLHNHNALGYGLGSLERSIDIARSHLDFFAFTGHSSWHDIHEMEGGREKNWIEGFKKLERAWPQVQRLTADSNKEDEFVSFLGFEWHSSMYGDQCVVLPDDNHPLVFPDSLTGLRAYCVERNGLMIPHHLAYKTGHRGVNWDEFDCQCSPVVEIYSEHGNSESDRGPFDYFNHSMGGRVSQNTAQAALAAGHQFGFVASSDNHRGFPGGYGEGLMGVWADGLSRESVLTAIRERKTVALTGDRIGVYFSVEGEPLGTSLQALRDVELAYEVTGRDEIEVVEIIVNGQVVDRVYPELEHSTAPPHDRHQVRFEWGWGPWADMDLARVCDWRFDLDVQSGRLIQAYPCFQSGPFDEHRRHEMNVAGNRMEVTSFTGRRDAYRQNPNQSVVLDIDGDHRTSIDLNISSPTPLSQTLSFSDLAASSEMIFTGPFPAESCLFHRLVPRNQSRVSGTLSVGLESGTNYIYLRVRQRNGQMAWASPIFVTVD